MAYRAQPITKFNREFVILRVQPNYPICGPTMRQRDTKNSIPRMRVHNSRQNLQIPFALIKINQVSHSIR